MQKPIKTTGENIDFYSDAIGDAAEFSFEEFLKWFNANANMTEVIDSGYKDFFGEILKDKLYATTRKNSEEMTALEIGCGGGRITNAACKYFGKVLGLDIHNNLALAEKFLKSRGNENFELSKIKDDKFFVDDNSVDFVYSYIVFQHVLKINCFENYAKEVSRVLKDKGLVIIYFGRPRLFSRIISKNVLLNIITVFFDRAIFELYLNIFKNGYREYDKVKVNVVNIVVTMRKAKKIFRAAGLKILESDLTLREKRYGGTQYYLILRKK